MARQRGGSEGSQRAGGAVLRVGLWVLAMVMVAGLAPQAVHGGTWRVGDRDQPWRLHPVSFRMDRGWLYKPQFTLGGSWACEVAIDDDGDGLIDEDGVDLVDNDHDMLWNEDPADGVDNDHDGLVDEDGPDPQVDNDGDGLINEDGRITGGEVYDPSMKKWLEAEPFFRYGTEAEAEADANGWGSGYGWGDDDSDAKFNEDKLDGLDNDHDGLVDEDGTEPAAPLPQTWQRWVFAYEADSLSVEDRKGVQWLLQPGGTQMMGVHIVGGDTTAITLAGGGPLVARRTRRSFHPADYIRPVRMDSTRNLFRYLCDQYQAGQYQQSPLNAQYYGSAQPTAFQGTSGWGQVVDGNIFTARVQSRTGREAGFRGELRGLYLVDRVRMYPRPDFPDRSPYSFYIRYAGNDPQDFRESYAKGEYSKRMVVSRYLIPKQDDWVKPAVKDIRLDGGKFGDPVPARVIQMQTSEPEGVTWELAEMETYARGYALDAYYTTEIIDVGSATPQVRRYYDPNEPDRWVPMEAVRNLDKNSDGTIEPEETARYKLNSQFDMDAPGSPVTWGRVRWSGKLEGQGGNVQIRMRAGTTPDPYVYMRRIGQGVYSPYIETPIVKDWPKRGEPIDAFMYVALPPNARAHGSVLPYNVPGDADGAPGGWSFWSVPYNFEDAQVDENGQGGIAMPLPPLTRYVQFRLDFQVPPTADSGVSLDWLEFEFYDPYVRAGLVAEVFTDTLSAEGKPVPVVLGKAYPYVYVVKPVFQDRQDLGFNRLDVVVPTLSAQLEDFLVDDLSWERYEPEVPGNLTGEDAAAYRDSLLHSKAWLDGVTLTEPKTYAAAVYEDTATHRVILGIKTPRMTYAQFPRGQDRDIKLHLRTPVYKLLTDFPSWIRDDSRDEAIIQAATPGNAADDLPLDGTTVAAQETARSVEVSSVQPNPFSPNGDGINDEAVFRIRLFLVTAQVETRVEIHDLSGRMVRVLGPVRMHAGAQTLTWDGRDDDGNLVAPGIYLYALSVSSDANNDLQMGTVAVAY